MRIHLAMTVPAVELDFPGLRSSVFAGIDRHRCLDVARLIAANLAALAGVYRVVCDGDNATALPVGLVFCRAGNIRPDGRIERA